MLSGGIVVLCVCGPVQVRMNESEKVMKWKCEF